MAADLPAPVTGGDAWLAIMVAGGLAWLLVTWTSIVWLWSSAGTVQGGMYIVTTPARIVQHLMLFAAAAVLYRLVIAMGWPSAVRTRAGVIIVNVLLALIFVRVAVYPLAWSAGLIDRRPADMSDMLREWDLFSVPWMDLGNLLRAVLPTYVLGLCATLLMLVLRRYHRELVRSAQLSRAYAASRMETLSAQLQPHFLFNALHTVTELVEESPREAALMVTRLGDFLRHALESNHTPWVDLGTELRGIEAYLAVQQVRFRDRMTVRTEVSEQALSFPVPALLLQPLVENAIEHGRRGEGLLTVSVRAQLVEGRLSVWVCNSTPRLAAPVEPRDYGRGLGNVALRLRAAYGQRAVLSVGPDPQGSGSCARLDLPREHSSADARVSPHE